IVVAWGLQCFFFQAEDGIRDRNVTGVQTCALPILGWSRGIGRRGCLQGPSPAGGAVPLPGCLGAHHLYLRSLVSDHESRKRSREIGRASCRERGWSWVGGRRLSG